MFSYSKKWKIASGLAKLLVSNQLVSQELDVLEGLEYSDNPGSYAVGSLTTGWVSHARQVLVGCSSPVTNRGCNFSPSMNSPRVPRAHLAGFSRRSLDGVGLSESVRCHGPGPALLTNGGVQQQQHFGLSNLIL
ncbi:hypothetical protein TNCV_859811 [Trichonephila clavipes]|nr:hypothetical protein TNCV_859811 [Trichonephila clavipes]